jgi:hypothetical protein
MPVAKSLEIWTAQTLCVIGILLSAFSFLLHVGRPYFERILGRMTLRVAAELWCLVDVVLRDGSLLFAVLLGFLNLNGVMAAARASKSVRSWRLNCMANQASTGVSRRNPHGNRERTRCISQDRRSADPDLARNQLHSS